MLRLFNANEKSKETLSSDFFEFMLFAIAIMFSSSIP